MFSDRIKPMNRHDGRGGTAKGGVKSPKNRRQTAAKKASAQAGPPESGLLEESDGFQIFKADPGARAASAAKARASRDIDRQKEAPDRQPPAPVADAPAAAEYGSLPDLAVARWMANTIKSVVHEEMQTSVDRITRSVVRETLAKDTAKN